MQCPSHPFRRCHPCDIPGDANLDHLVDVVLARWLHCSVTVSPFPSLEVNPEAQATLKEFGRVKPYFLEMEVLHVLFVGLQDT